MSFTARGSGGAVAATPTAATIVDTLTGGGVLWVVIGTRGTVSVPTPTVTSPGATFTLAVTQIRPEDDRRVSIFWSNDYDAGADMVLTITHGTAPTAVAWGAVEQFGVLVSGNPVAQSNSTANASSSTPSTTLTAGTGEMLCAVCWASGSISATGGSGTELFDVVSATTGIAGYGSASTSTNPAITLSTASTTAFAALETVAAAAGLPYEVVVAGAKRPVVSDAVIIGGVKKTVVNRWVVVAGAKRPLV